MEHLWSKIKSWIEAKFNGATFISHGIDFGDGYELQCDATVNFSGCNVFIGYGCNVNLGGSTEISVDNGVNVASYTIPLLQGMHLFQARQTDLFTISSGVGNTVYCMLINGTSIQTFSISARGRYVAHTESGAALLVWI